MSTDIPLKLIKKLKIEHPLIWDHHRSGWKYVIQLLSQYLTCDNGVLFISSIDDVIFEEQVINEPWVGFFHQVPRTDYKYFPDLERAIKSQTWKKSLPYCQGIFVLSDYLKKYLLSQEISVPIEKIYYPMGEQGEPFSWSHFCHNSNPKLLFIGEYLRDFQSFYDLKTDYQKIILAPENYDPSRYKTNDTVNLQKRISDADYDHILSKNIVFLKLFDAPANTTVVECISRNTPIIINRLEGIVEYLGEDYPLYYDSLEEASEIIKDLDLIYAAHIYLKKWTLKPQLTEENFIQSFHNSSTYKNLPAPSY